jgi:hypothetical protein
MQDRTYELGGQCNLAALSIKGFSILTVASLLLFVLAYFLGIAVREATLLSWQPGNYIVSISLPTLLVTLVVVIILHELIHGIAFLASGRKPYFGYRLIRKFFPVFYTSFRGAPISRNRYVVSCLAPFAVFTVVCLVISALVSDYHTAVIFLLTMAINASASTGDLWITWNVHKYGARILFEDTIDGFNWYLPPDFE